MIIQLLVDNPKSWYFRYVRDLQNDLTQLGHQCYLRMKASSVENGDVLFILSCDKIVPKEIRDKSKYNIVIHASDVPRGRGWSPMTWQILEGKNTIFVSLFEAADKADSGNVYLRDYILLEGTELIDEWRELLGHKVNEMAIEFINQLPNVKGEVQDGDASYYQKRTPEDSKLDVNKTIEEQFNLLRVVDNKQYPAFFHYKGKKFVIRISRE